jgi:hypothetical protein
MGLMAQRKQIERPRVSTAQGPPGFPRARPEGHSRGPDTGNLRVNKPERKLARLNTGRANSAIEKDYFPPIAASSQ